MTWFFIAIGVALIGFGSFGIIRGLRGLRSATSEFDRTIVPNQGLFMIGLIAVFAGLLPLLLGILPFFIGK